MIWRNPVAWLGLATLLIPVLIHLLVRHRAEPRQFPSLRFVQPTRLASVRRKMISDWPLLLVRIAMLAAAVAALADPFWMTAARRADWSERQARAIVVDTTPSVSGGGAGATAAAGATGAGGATAAAGAGAGDSSRTLAERETESAFRAETFGTTNLADGIRRAAAWLRTAPPARRELVVISDFQLGALDPTSLRDIPPYVGIRLVRTAGAPVTRAADGLPRTQRAAAGGFTLRNPRVTVNASDTSVTWTDAASPASSPSASSSTAASAGTSPSTSPRVEIDASEAANSQRSEITLRPFDLKLRGAAADRPFLLAASEAVLAQGIPVATGGRSPRHTATLIVGIDAANEGAPAPLASWQVDAARAIATNVDLARAVGRVTVGAKSGRASNGAIDVPAPWVVLMRDAGGAPAILAAAENADANARMLLWSRVASADEATALLIRATLRAMAGADAFGEAEVIAIPDATLAQWQRPASDPPVSEWSDVESNDRRWLWGVVLALIGAEQFLRRRARHAEAQVDRKVYEHEHAA